MKHLAVALSTIVAIQAVQAEDGGDQWIMEYYKKPTPEKFIGEVHAMARKGSLKEENAQPPLIAFLSQLMAANPKRVPDWLEEFKDLDEAQRAVLWDAAWYSGTEEAKAFFKKQKADAYLQEEAPDILKLEVNNPPTLDMLWGYFFATGKPEPIRRIVSGLSLSKHSGALERFKTSAKTEQDQKEAYLDVTFQSVQWSLEGNCRQHPVVLEHCEKIFTDPKLPKDQGLWLAVILAKVKPEKYSLSIDGEKLGTPGKGPTPK